jgi:hypothetical protein
MDASTYAAENPDLSSAGWRDSDVSEERHERDRAEMTDDGEYKNPKWGEVSRDKTHQ